MSQLHSLTLPFLGAGICPWNNPEAKTKHAQLNLQSEEYCIIEDCWCVEAQTVNECTVYHVWFMISKTQAIIWRSLWAGMVITCLSWWKVYPKLHYWTHFHVRADKSKILQCSKDHHKVHFRTQYRFSGWHLENFKQVLPSSKLRRRLVALLRKLLFPAILQFQAILLSFQANSAQLIDTPIYMWVSSSLHYLFHLLQRAPMLLL